MKARTLYLGFVFCFAFAMVVTAAPVSAEGEPPVWPPTEFWNDPADPSIYDRVTFGLYGYAPAEWQCHWDFGNGTSLNECFAYQAVKYQQDGDYTVAVQVTNELGATATASRNISVKTHDVAITRFDVPQTAKSGKTRQLAVYVSNSRYGETVQVNLYHSTLNGNELFGTLIQYVAPKRSNKTTAFNFTYTFTAADASIGKVTFTAEAVLLGGVRDGWMVDNRAIALPTRVSR